MLLEQSRSAGLHFNFVESLNVLSLAKLYTLAVGARGQLDGTSSDLITIMVIWGDVQQLQL